MSDRTDAAKSVTVSYPADLSEWGREAVDKPSFRRYLGKVHETATVGDVWEEFVGVGCCGDTLDVPLRVESIEGDSSIDEATEFVFEEREACEIEGGWQVQSQAGP